MTVEVAWRRNDKNSVQLRWSEAGGPPVDPPRSRGFGSSLIEGGLFGGETDGAWLDYQPSGVCGTIEIALPG